MTDTDNAAPNLSETPDRPGVIAPPPVIVLAAVLIGVGLHLLWPLDLLDGVARWVATGILGGAALALVAVSLVQFRRHKTHVDPYRPATALLSAGPYRFSRNPIYIALGLLQAGIAFAADSIWILAMLAPALAVLHVGVIRREERYLARKFEAEYAAYRARVRRWI
ncbi:MAG: methyltransferase family protein [Alphaproteobacteria bacterium]